MQLDELITDIRELCSPKYLALIFMAEGTKFRTMTVCWRIFPSAVTEEMQ